mmetsp:Transcript_59262/g.89419  ORF Transcript_59262/g.89419 Transcript_59262/m.89419 type:complete len:92 (+) Transcript_59262:1433-1708(+)
MAKKSSGTWQQSRVPTGPSQGQPQEVLDYAPSLVPPLTTYRWNDGIAGAKFLNTHTKCCSAASFCELAYCYSYRTPPPPLSTFNFSGALVM